MVSQVRPFISSQWFQSADGWVCVLSYGVMCELVAGVAMCEGLLMWRWCCMGQERARVAAQRRAAPGRRPGAPARGDFARITFYTYLVDHIHFSTPCL